MKRNVSNHSYRDEKLRSSHSENYETDLRRTEEERLRRRREWIVEQQMLREHEKLKKKKILEYEIRRALEKGLSLPKERFSHHSSNTSESKSPESQHRTVATLSTSNTSILSKKLEASDGTTPLFKGPEGIQVTAAELRRIKVYIHRNSFTEDIHRNVSDEATDDLQRDIINFEDVLVKRREGEGSKSIFEREEIKSVTAKTEEIVEHRTVVAINNENLENKPEANKEYTTSSRSRSPPCRSSHHTRYKDSKHNNRDSYRNDRDRDHSRGGSREYKEKVRLHSQLHTAEEKHLRERKSNRDNSHSKGGEQRAWVKDSHNSNKSSKHERPYREKSRERFRERRERDKSRERRLPPSHYIEPIPVPVYYGGFPPRPIMVGPLVPIPRQVPLKGIRHMMSPLRPYPPRFIQPDIYRFCPFPNPNLGQCINGGFMMNGKLLH
ncbi:zinc finger CCCH domain-containing protein 5-like [Bombus impatiens]|uniref:Zinc finger CCCH domain-containing protein 5-like n=1 Tax=Bombus impatiens TaxID=132113 RepID=A0A6P3UYH2_BOMIM|nr:zinc finger CCCH domain-containing protein 5-like [Bombus impatiens]